MATTNLDESSPLTADGQNISLDNVTLSQTPVPMAASTAGRQLKIKDARFRIFDIVFSS